MAKQVPYKVRLHIISPVHIGCDDVYEPTGFVVDKGAKRLVAFDPLDFVRSLDTANRAKFLTICDKGTLESIIELYRFMGKCKVQPEWRSVAVSEGFLSSYDRVMTKINPRIERDIKQELNKFLIARTSYLPLDQAPYIPGSALKGALRTGWLNDLNQGRKSELNLNDRNAAKDLEKGLMKGTFEADPFRLVKISDLLPVGIPETRICYAVNKKKKLSQHEARGPQQILEVIRHDKQAIFEGVITLHEPEQGSPIRRENAVPADQAFFLKATGFFLKEMLSDADPLKGINLPSGVQDAMKKAFGDRFLKEVFPVRIGRHAGAESVTVAGARNIRIMGKQGEPAKNGFNSTTLWLAGDSPKAENNLHPFGWVALEILPPDAANPYPMRTFVDRKVSAAGVIPLALQQVALPKAPLERMVWEKAVVTWSPGNTTLTASFEGKKADIRLSGERSLVAESLHKKLFEKKAPVSARVTLEKEGNLLKIIMVESI